MRQNTHVEAEKCFARSYERDIKYIQHATFEDKVLSFEQDGSVPEWHDGNEGMQGPVYFRLWKS